MPWLPWLPWLNKLTILCDVTMATQQCYINNLNSLLIKAHLTNFRLNNFKIVEAMGLKKLH
jgi:hypothetical protein